MSQKTNILHVLNARGGVDVYVRYLCQFLPENEYDIKVVRSIYDGEKKFKNNLGEDLEEYRIPMVREISLFNDLKSLLALIKIIKKAKPDIIHCHSAKGGVIGRLAALFLNIPVIYTPHAFSYLSTESSIKEKIYLTIEKWLKIKKGKGMLLACAKTEATRAINDLNYNPGIVRAWPNSIPKIKTSKPSTEIIEIENPYACTIGRPSYQKNLSLMVDAIKLVVDEIPKFQFIIMGIGHYSPEVTNLKKKIDKLGLTNNITLVDWTDREHILDILSGSMFFVSTSRYEGLPYSLLESMVLGKPAVASNVDGNSDLIVNGENGLLFDLNDVQTLAHQIIKLNNDVELREKLGKAAKNSISENNSLPQNINSIKDVYSSVLNLA